MTELLAVTEASIRVDVKHFHTFVKELKKDSSMEHISNELNSTCGECDSERTIVF